MSASFDQFGQSDTNNSFEKSNNSFEKGNNSFEESDDDWGDGGVSMVSEISEQTLFDNDNMHEKYENHYIDPLMELVNPQLYAAPSFTDEQLADYFEAFLLEFMLGLGNGIAHHRDEAILLLLNAKWNSSNIIDGSTIDDIRQRAGIYTNRSTDSNGSTKTDIPTEICSVCWENMANESLSCGHKHCSDCWTDHIHSSVCIEGKMSISCMTKGCSIKIPLSFLENHQCDCSTNSYDHVYQSLIRDFCKYRPIVQCPSPTCLLWVDNVKKSSSVLCQCGFRFCFECRIHDREFPDHAPITCDQQLEWSRREASLQEDASMRYIRSNAKQCPRCGTAQIRIPGTCSHLRCGGHTHGSSDQPIHGCGLEYCYHCRRPWKECLDYKCNRNSAQEDDTEAKNNERFILFFSKYDDTQIWLKNGIQPLISDCYERIDQYLQQPSMYTKLKCDDAEHLLKSAVAAEISGKQLLLNTYILSYFMKESPALQMFQECQSKLEQLSDTIFNLNRKPLHELDKDELRKARDESKNWNAAMVKTLTQIRLTNQ